jgi:hypothetical protein
MSPNWWSGSWESAGSPTGSHRSVRDGPLRPVGIPAFVDHVESAAFVHLGLLAHGFRC